MPAHPPLRATTFCTLLAVALLCTGDPVATVRSAAQVSNHGVSASGHTVPCVDEAGQELKRDASGSGNLDEDQAGSQDALAASHTSLARQRPSASTPSERFVLGHPQIAAAQCVASAGARAPPRA